MSFLPDSYEPPATGKYMKLQSGDNRFRVMGSAIIGNEFWKTENGNRMPVRRHENEPIEKHELGIDQYGDPEKPKHFWAFPVWDYLSKSIQILQITQRTIQDGIRALTESPDWGDPHLYDITIKKSGEGKDKTKYAVIAAPPASVDSAILAEYQGMSINLDALYRGEDPFAPPEVLSHRPPETSQKSTTAPLPAVPVVDLIKIARDDCMDTFIKEYEGDKIKAKEEMKKKAEEMTPGMPSSQYTEKDWRNLEGSFIPF